MSPSELGDRLIVTRSTVTGVLDSLERRGLVRRSPHPTDRRSVVVEITAKGLRVLGEVRAVVADWAAMRDRAKALAAALATEKMPVDPEDVSESKAFLSLHPAILRVGD